MRSCLIVIPKIARYK